MTPFVLIGWVVAICTAIVLIAITSMIVAAVVIGIRNHVRRTMPYVNTDWVDDAE